jgi:hypothetical protein
MVVYETSDISREGRRGKPKNTLSPRIQATEVRTESEILASLNLYRETSFRRQRSCSRVLMFIRTANWLYPGSG